MPLVIVPNYFQSFARVVYLWRLVLENMSHFNTVLPSLAHLEFFRLN